MERECRGRHIERLSDLACSKPTLAILWRMSVYERAEDRKARLLREGGESGDCSFHFHISIYMEIWKWSQEAARCKQKGRPEGRPFTYSMKPISARDGSRGLLLR